MLLNFGSINIDRVYRVQAAPRPGETIHSLAYDQFIGGKGFNQSVAARRAGGDVRHIGYVGAADHIVPRIAEFGLDVADIQEINTPSGHAIIIVDTAGENQIILFAGANYAYTIDGVATSLAAGRDQGHWVVLQNEINLSAEIAAEAKRNGYSVCYSAAPFDITAVNAILPHIDLLAVNETELAALLSATGQTLGALALPMVLVTLGAEGAELHQNGQIIQQAGHRVEAIDTTGAGDTFLGSFLARLDAGDDAARALQYASAAAAIQVTRAGAAVAIPSREVVLEFMKDRTTI